MCLHSGMAAVSLTGLTGRPRVGLVARHLCPRSVAPGWGTKWGGYTVEMLVVCCAGPAVDAVVRLVFM